MAGSGRVHVGGAAGGPRGATGRPRVGPRLAAGVPVWAPVRRGGDRSAARRARGIAADLLDRAAVRGAMAGIARLSCGCPVAAGPPGAGAARAAAARASAPTHPGAGGRIAGGA